MYVFGGKDEDNEKLKDFWCFDFETSEWHKLPSDDDFLTSRSGHCCQVYKHYMIIFAGIHEVTQELDDMAAFDFNSQKWIYLFGEA